MKTYTSLFSGGGGACLGFKKAGFEMAQGFEWDAQIVEVANTNGLPVKEADVTKLNPKKLESTYALHASPVCTNVSVANTSGKEEQSDIDAARKVAEFLTTWSDTKAFSMENVMPYQHTESFAIILNALELSGYQYRFFRMPFANYGVPQTRERLIVLAHKDYLPAIPTPTHSKQPENLFMSQWIGWYAAIEDLLDTLPESKFADWQLKRLEELDWFGTGLFPSGNVNANTFSVRKRDEPAQTQLNGCNKAFLAVMDRRDTCRSKENFSFEPSNTVLASQTQKAFIMDGAAGSYGETVTIRKQDEPVFTQTASMGHRVMRPWLNQGRVVRMTPRANARFQSFPDSYILPENTTLAQKIIGNAVPPLGAFHFAKELNR